jgi:CO dehydrogenase/acetyl-CoA synthase alpha subunit
MTRVNSTAPAMPPPIAPLAAVLKTEDVIVIAGVAVLAVVDDTCSELDVDDETVDVDVAVVALNIRTGVVLALAPMPVKEGGTPLCSYGIHS